MKSLLIIVVSILLSISNCVAQADSLMNQGRQAAKERNLTKAQMFFKQALLYTKSPSKKAAIHNNLGIINYLQKQYKKAELEYNKAIHHYSKIKNKEKLAETYNNLAMIHKRTDKYDESLQAFDKAFSLSDNSKLKSKILGNIGRITYKTKEYNKGIIHFKNLFKYDKHFLVSQNIARLYNKLNNLDSTLYYYDKSLSLSKVNEYNYIEILKEKADVFYHSGKHQEALITYLKCIKLHEDLNNTYYADPTKIQSNEKSKDIFTSAIECSIKLENTEQALRIMDKFKAPILNEKLRLNNLPDSLQLKFWRVNNKIRKAIKAEKFEDLNDHFTQKEKMIKGLETKISDHFNKTLYKLPGNMAMINYSYSDSLLTSIVYSQGKLKAYSKKIDSGFKQDITIAHQQSKMLANSTHQKYKNYLRALTRLHKILLPELPKSIKRLMIIPYSELYHIPFDALTLSPPSEKWANFSKIEYLANKYAISYNLSLSSLNTAGNRVAKNAISIVPSYVDSLKLDYGIIESKTLSKYIKTNIVRENYNADSIFNNLNKYDVISVIAHGEDGAIILDQDTAYIENYILLKLNNPLTVLSTCQSNTGELISTEGYLGTARKFMEVGSQTTIASQWSIPDKSTSIIMSDFYKNLNDGLEADIALNKAKMDYLQDNAGVHRSPASWAGIILMGNYTPIELKSNEFLIWILLVLFVVVIGSIHFYRKNLKSKV